MESSIRHYWSKIQRCFSFEDEESSMPQTPKHLELIVVLDYLDIPKIFHSEVGYRGRPERDRSALACAFVAKAVLNLATTEALIDRLKVDKVLRRICLFESNKKLPCKATFSNAFRKFAEDNFAGTMHEAVVKQAFSKHLVGHVSRDSTSIVAREKKSGVKKAKWRRPKGKRRRLVKQASMSLNEMLTDLPKQSDLGRKNGHTWNGYKLHLDVADGDIPLSAILTSASVHDSQVAIPLETITSQRVTSLYTLMDSAYDAKEIRSYVESKGKVSIINPQKRTPQPNALDPASRSRLAERNAVERVNSRIKDRFGARFLRVKGHSKIMAHLMFGICALTVLQIVNQLN